jgi:hypothetical protein
VAQGANNLYAIVPRDYAPAIGSTISKLFAMRKFFAISFVLFGLSFLMEAFLSMERAAPTITILAPPPSSLELARFATDPDDQEAAQQLPPRRIKTLAVKSADIDSTSEPNSTQKLASTGKVDLARKKGRRSRDAATSVAADAPLQTSNTTVAAAASPVKPSKPIPLDESSNFHSRQPTLVGQQLRLLKR